jgi:hypothetical protein
VAVPGASVTPTPGWMLRAAWAFFVGSACGVTVMVTVLGFGGVTGAV